MVSIPRITSPFLKPALYATLVSSSTEIITGILGLINGPSASFFFSTSLPMRSTGIFSIVSLPSLSTVTSLLTTNTFFKISVYSTTGLPSTASTLSPFLNPRSLNNESLKVMPYFKEEAGIFFSPQVINIPA